MLPYNQTSCRKAYDTAPIIHLQTKLHLQPVLTVSRDLQENSIHCSITNARLLVGKLKLYNVTVALYICKMIYFQYISYHQSDTLHSPVDTATISVENDTGPLISYV